MKRRLKTSDCDSRALLLIKVSTKKDTHDEFGASEQFVEERGVLVVATEALQVRGHRAGQATEVVVCGSRTTAALGGHPAGLVVLNTTHRHNLHKPTSTENSLLGSICLFSLSTPNPGFSTRGF